MQAQVLAGPEDPARFHEAVEAFRKSFCERPVLRSSANHGRIVELDKQDAEPAPSTRNGVTKTYHSLGYSEKKIDGLLMYLGWKVGRLSDSHSRILSIGCGGGDELVFLRARYPNASITALDYPMKSGSRDKIIKIVQCEFIAGDIFDSLAALKARGESFDLIFSNHFIEHLFEPDQQIRDLTQLLCRGGVFAAGLPLDAYPHQELLARKAKRVDTIHALDINWLDPRHPWKTNELDLALTLNNANLQDVTIYRRLYHTSRTYPISLEGCRQRERRAALFYALLLNAPVSVLKIILGRNPPRRLARLVFALDRRLWFGRYRLKCDVQPEIFVTASRS
jgi:SAM-dependent methyltransferase